MAISAKQRQKKLEKKSKKRKLVKKSLSSALQIRDKALNYAKFPIHECLFPSNLLETGLGNVIVARRTTDGSIATSAFVVDVFCLGVKNALFKVSSEFDYEYSIKPKLSGGLDGPSLEVVHPSCARKLIEGAVLYAKELGFSPHRDYNDAKGIFGNIDASACPVKYSYGSDGKPYYIRGPNESPAQVKKIIDQLHKTCGEGNYHYLTMLGGEMFE